MGRFIDRTGTRYGRLLVVAGLGPNTHGQHRWRCRCDCGVEIEVPGSSLATGNTRSCGCLRDDTTRVRSTSHGHKTRTDPAPEYAVWVAMIRRCHDPTDPSFDNYGGRGIAVSAGWRESYTTFISDMGRRPSPAHTIERRNNGGGYNPSNCYWATRTEQANNRRGNTLVFFGGRMQPITPLAREHGQKPSAVRWRLANGWSIEEALGLR